MNELIVKVENKDGKLVVGSRVIAEQLDKEHKHVLAKIKECLNIEDSENYFIKSTYTNSQNKTQPEYLVNICGLKILLSKYTSVKKKDYVNLGITDIDVRHTYTRFEVAFRDMLKEALSELGLGIVEQFPVDGYRVDFYLPKYNLCIEYDERQHFVKSNITKDSKRQTYIENKIGAKFIRCDYRDSNIKNIMKILKEINFDTVSSNEQ